LIHTPARCGHPTARRRAAGTDSAEACAGGAEGLRAAGSRGTRLTRPAVACADVLRHCCLHPARHDVSMPRNPAPPRACVTATHGRTVLTPARCVCICGSVLQRPPVLRQRGLHVRQHARRSRPRSQHPASSSRLPACQAVHSAGRLTAWGAALRRLRCGFCVVTPVSASCSADLSPTSVAMPTYNGAIDESFGCAVSTKCLADGTPTGASCARLSAGACCVAREMYTWKS